MRFGIRVNSAQFALLLLQVLSVGMTIEMMRTVVPALAETAFGVPRGSFLLLVAFVVAFGLIKVAMNLKRATWGAFYWRRERDSNPRYGFAVHTISNRAPSASRSPLRVRANVAHRAVLSQ